MHPLTDLVRRYNVAEREQARLYLPATVTISDIHTIRAISEVGSGGVVAVAAFLGVTIPTASQAVSRLSEKGLVCREVSPVDTRRSTLRLTQEGTELLTRIEAMERAVVAELEDAIDRGRATLG